MHKPFEQLGLLVDQFYQEKDEPVKRGAKPKYDNAFYLKLYFFGILNRCPEKIRFLPRAEREYPHLFKKTFPKHSLATLVVGGGGRPTLLVLATEEAKVGRTG